MSPPVDRRPPLAHPALAWLLPAAVLGLTLLLTAISLRRDTTARAAALAQQVEAFRGALAVALRRQLDILPSLRQAASGPTPLDDARLAQQTRRLLAGERRPGLILIFVAERVDAAGRAAFVARVRADRSTDPAGHPSFDIQPPGAHAEYMLLRHQHPADPTNDGYDLYDPGKTYRAVVDHAIAAGGLVATAPLLLARDRHRPGHPELVSVVVRAATYRDDRLPTTAEARRAAATGVVGIALRSAEVVRSALPEALSGRVRVRVTDTDSPTPVYDSEPGATPPAPALGFELPVADRHWHVDVTPPPLAGWQQADEGTLALLLAGTAGAAVLAAALARRRSQT